MCLASRKRVHELVVAIAEALEAKGITYEDLMEWDRIAQEEARAEKERIMKEKE